MQKESSFAVGDRVELLTGDHTLLCGWCRIAVQDHYICDRPIGEAAGLFKVDFPEYEMGAWTYILQNEHGNVVVCVPENDLRRVS